MNKLYELKCPSCSAQLDYEEGREYIFCKYCGSKVSIHDENTYTFKNVDYAQMERARNEAKRISLQEDIIRKEYEKEEIETQKYHRNSLIYAVILAVLVLIMIIADSLDEHATTAIIMMDIVMFYVLFMMGRAIKHSEKEKERYREKMRINGINTIELSPEIFNYENRDCETLRRHCEALGFQNVQTLPLGDLNVFNSFRNGKVESILINGKSPKDIIYYPDDPVIIKYHSR